MIRRGRGRAESEFYSGSGVMVVELGDVPEAREPKKIFFKLATTTTPNAPNLKSRLQLQVLLYLCRIAINAAILWTAFNTNSLKV